VLGLSVAGATGCASRPVQPAGHADMTGELTRWGDVPSSSRGVTLLAGEPLPAAAGSAAVLVTVINQGRRPLRLERAQFVLTPQLATNGKDDEVAAESLVAPRPPVGDERREALPEGILKPGETARGYLYFGDGRRVGDLQLATRLVDAGSGEVIAVLSTPTGSPSRQNIR
jgi:hypothetical protein